MTLAALLSLWVVQLQELPDVQSLLDAVTGTWIFLALLTLLLAWLAVRGASWALDWMSRRVARARFFFKNLDPFVRIGIWCTAVYLVLLELSSTNAFLAGLGSIAIALGLGAQDLIKNVIGGIIVLSDRPYQLGDRVRIGGAYGEVDHIGIRSTKLTTPDDTRVTVPNAEVLTSQVYNANSGVPDCQVVTDLYLPADADPDEVMEIGRQTAYTSPYLLPSKPVTVLISDQFDQQPYLRLRVKAYVHDHRFEPSMQSDITVRAKKEFLRRGLLGAGFPPSKPDAPVTAGAPRPH